VDRLSGREHTVKREPASNPGKLARPNEFKAVLAADYRRGGKYFLVRALGNGRVLARLGLVVSRKAAPRAVDRNRGKRLVREAFRALRNQLPAVDIVFQQKNNLRNSANAAIREEIHRLLREVVSCFDKRDGDAASASVNHT
jgi:ribonuclease P protein component